MTTALAMLVLGMIASRILQRSYASLEERSTREHIEQTMNLLESQLRGLDELNASYAIWDDTYAFVEDNNPAYIASNFTDSTFTQSRLNLITVVHSSSRVIYQQAFDVENTHEVPIPTDWWLLLVAPGSPLLHGPDSTQSVLGIASLAEGPMLVVSRPILTSNNTGPARGSFIIGRYLNETELHGLATITGDQIAIRRLAATDLEPDFLAAREQLSLNASRLVRVLNEEQVAGYVLLKDVNGRPGFIVRVIMLRTINQQGQVSTRYLVFALLLALFLAGMVNLVVLERSVLRRVARLNSEMDAIAQSGDSAGRVTVSGQDELSALAQETNQMLAALAEQAAENTRLYQSVQAELVERERAERALAAAKDRAELLYRVVPSAIFTVDLQGVVTSVNAKAAEILGYQDSELVGQPCTIFAYEPCRHGCGLYNAAVSKPISGRECVVQTKDGDLRTVLKNADLIRDGDGQVIGGIESFTDITERKRVEAVLAEERNLLRMLTDNIPDSIYFKDTESRFTLINPTQARRFGLSDPAQAVGKTDFDFFTEEHARPAYEDEQAIMRSGQSLIDMEEKETWPDGRVGWVSTTKMPLRDQKGQSIGTLGLSRDITERKRAEEALRESNAQFRTLFEASPDAIVLIDPHDRWPILDCNPAACQMNGYTRDELVGQSIDVLNLTPGGPTERAEYMESIRQS
ncbi:MAG: PAS domain S-box protein, partial [Chloroflexi bacterium]|nr:PAS domain S-box protein [Chloroflexota bacterium]